MCLIVITLINLKNNSLQNCTVPSAYGSGQLNYFSLWLLCVLISWLKTKEHKKAIYDLLKEDYLGFFTFYCFL